jgi:hypothetical protein
MLLLEPRSRTGASACRKHLSKPTHATDSYSRFISNSRRRCRKMPIQNVRSKAEPSPNAQIMQPLVSFPKQAPRPMLCRVLQRKNSRKPCPTSNLPVKTRDRYQGQNCCHSLLHRKPYIVRVYPLDRRLLVTHCRYRVSWHVLCKRLAV